MSGYSRSNRIAGARLMGAVTVLAALSLLVGFSRVAAASLSPADAVLRAGYASPASQFADIDGETVHYADEGSGPAIVLIHGSFASLRQWDGWARDLSRNYRVIRFDASPAGLSGPNPRGDYSVARKIAIVDELTLRLGVKTFYVVATSSGGVLGAAYAAERPERVRGLVLNNIGYGPVRFDPATFSPEFKRALADDATHPGHHDPEFWRQILLRNFVDRTKVTPALVDQWTALNDRMLHMAITPAVGVRATDLERTPADLARITVPTLLLWSADDMETTLVGHGLPAFARLAAKDKMLVVIPRCGHMAPLECGDLGLEAVTPFFARLSEAAR